MMCAWQELLAVLPAWMRKEVDCIGSTDLRELRLRINAPPELILADRSYKLKRILTGDDINFTVNAASRYSPWAAVSAAQGYITAKGGHRIGLCGEMVTQQGTVTTIRNVTSLCVRIARDVQEIASGIEGVSGSILILGAPGWGKTTLLRDAIRKIGMREVVCVIDERGELFPEGFDGGKYVDVLTGCSKATGISMLLRTMGPRSIAVDEITDQEDTNALLYAANCGVRLLATAHGSSVSDLKKRLVYRPLLDNHVFDVLLVLKENQTYAIERMPG